MFVAGNAYVLADVVAWDVPFCIPTAPSLKALSPLAPEVLNQPALVTWVPKFYDPRKLVLDYRRTGVVRQLTAIPTQPIVGMALAVAHPRAFVEPHCTRCNGVLEAQALAATFVSDLDGRGAKGNLDPYIAGVVLVSKIKKVGLALPHNVVSDTVVQKCRRKHLSVLEVNPHNRLETPPNWAEKLPAFL